MREQQRQLLDVAVAIALLARQFIRDVEVTAERLQSHVPAGALLPTIELIAHEAELFPQTAHDTRGALRRDLDHRRDDLEHAAIEVNRAAGRKLRRLRRALQQR